MIDPKVIFVIGATGTGKSDVALQIGKYLQSTGAYEPHLINCDVMQMLPGLPVGTNKPTPVERSAIPHHFVESCASPTEENNVTVFVKEATELIATLTATRTRDGKQVIPIVCGGTCYYAQGLLFQENGTEGVAAEADIGADDEVTEKGAPPEGQGAASSSLSLWEELKALDPARAQQIHPNDTRRLQRRLEILNETPKIGSSEEKLLPKNVKLRYGSEGTFVLWIDWDSRADHMQALDQRVDKMVSRGLLQEVITFHRQLTKGVDDLKILTDRQKRERSGEDDVQSTVLHDDVGGGICLTHGLASAIGFKEFQPALLQRGQEGGDVAFTHPIWKECLDQLKSNTRRYAKQQKRWIVNRFLKKYLLALRDSQREWKIYRLARDAAMQCGVHVGTTLGEAIDACFLKGRLKLDTKFPMSASTGDKGPVVYAHHAMSFTDLDEDDDGAPVAGGGKRVAQIQRCDLCNVTTMDNLQWAKHLDSKQHKGALRRERRTAELAVRGIEVKPKGKKKDPKAE